MFREYEIIVWFCFCSPSQLETLLLDATTGGIMDEPKAKKLMLNHLINTAFFTKRQISDDETFR